MGGSEALMNAKSDQASAESDFIVVTAAQIENMDKEHVFGMVVELLKQEGMNDFHLGGALSVIKSNGWWESEGYESFKDFTVGKFDLHYRKAMYLISIYTDLVESGVAWESVAAVGWTKLKELAPIINKDNVSEWVAKAQTMTVLQLQDAVKKATQGTLVANAMPESTPVTTFTLKVHEDQKENIQAAIEKAKNDAETENGAVALDAICTNYLTGDGSKKQKSLKSLMEAAGYEVVLENFEALWPDVDVSVTIPE